MQANPNQRAFDIGEYLDNMYVYISLTHTHTHTHSHSHSHTHSHTHSLTHSLTHTPHTHTHVYIQCTTRIHIHMLHLLVISNFLIDRKNCENADVIEDLGHNAFSVQWSPTRGQTKVHPIIMIMNASHDYWPPFLLIMHTR